MVRLGRILVVVAALALSAPAGAQQSPDAGSSSESGGGSGSVPAGWATVSVPSEVAAKKYADLLGKSWSSQEGCTVEWKVVWKVEGGSFSLVPGGGSNVGGAEAHHAVCDKYRALADFGGPKVGLTVLEGVVQRIAVLPGGLEDAAAQKTEITQYFDAACSDKTEEASAQAFETLYRDCGGFDVGLAGGDSELSLYFFGDYPTFRSRMDALPMPTKPDD